MSIHNTSTKRS
ncbi:hypothetical protein KIPB_015688, partial [Kipferlia bialata]|eukprot:g15688.t1